MDPRQNLHTESDSVNLCWTDAPCRVSVQAMLLSPECAPVGPH